MRLPLANSVGPPARYALLALMLWPVLITSAVAGQPPISPAERPPAATEQATLSPPLTPAGLNPCPVVFAGVLGDRQRMVQVAMIFMGVAILILTRGNKF